MLRNISKRKHASLDNICYLMTSEISEDSLHNQIETFRESMHFCAELPISSNEFYKAGQNAIKAEILLLVNSEEYGNQESIRYNDIMYDIYRVYPASDGMIELYLMRKSGVIPVTKISTINDMQELTIFKLEESTIKYLEDSE